MTFVQRPNAFRKALFVSIVSFVTTIAFTAEAETHMIDRGLYSSEINGMAVSFYARDLQTGAEHVLSESDLDTRHAPWSTFKIPNLMIALETGAATSLEDWRDWDPKRRPAASYWPDAWKEGQTLGMAFARSSAWYFQDLALEVGARNYRKILRAWHYGNASVPDNADDFWLGSSLEISVREQVEFLSALLSGELSVSPATLEALDTASLAVTASAISLHGKTGSGPDDPARVDGKFSGWYVGYLRRGHQEPVVFALHVAAPSFTALRNFRKSFSIRLLEDSGLLPTGELPR